ncbi:DUF2849 domain-containing protein [Qipengyuania sediminis]|uniref:DUF2849 domain-containing protein n=1 Tax=Qipengyuania sediminis TaxID=1532023 RepID=UPI00105997B3|nr:DUF2849 domain-containing protein [Qipengyuania sediminis]
MRILTGNDLRTGAVVWWAGTHWSPHLAEAVDATGEEERVIGREEAARRVNAAYAIDAVLDGGIPRPAHIKDRIRALGPTVRPDLTLKPADPSAGSWVI